MISLKSAKPRKRSGGNSLWHEYPIPTDYEKQKEVIRSLRKWILQLEKDNLIVGFAFDHYFSNPDVPDELRIRFEYKDEHNRESVESELETEVKKLLPTYVKKEQIWGSDTTDRHILQAYEFGSRCAFLAWELIEQGRFPQLYFSRAVIGQTQDGLIAHKVPIEFQTHFNHGVMNSLGIPKVPDEREIHLNNLMDSTNSKTKQELINWLQANVRG
jgi:hypothetical protein